MSSKSVSSISSTQVAKSILRTLIYFDVFKHPLDASELQAYCNFPKVNQTAINESLINLEVAGLIHQHLGYYSISKQENRAIRRIDANKRAEPYIKLAFRLSRWIGAFPFVRAVMISGSLSKRCVYKDSDIDYLIITKGNRIWFVRGALRLLVKLLFLKRFKKYFCLNYFLDQDHLTLDLQNHYIASEMAFLIPTYGKEEYLKLWEENEWVRDYYPNFPLAQVAHIPSSKPKALKALSEWLLNNKLVDYLDHSYQKYSNRNWAKKQKEKEISKTALIEGELGEIKSFSFTPEAFMSVFQQRIQQFEEKYGLSLQD